MGTTGAVPSQKSPKCRARIAKPSLEMNGYYATRAGYLQGTRRSPPAEEGTQTP
jgi:hypothetical protein